MSTRRLSNVRMWMSVSRVGVRAFCVRVPLCPHRWARGARRCGGRPHGQEGGLDLAVLPYPRTARPSAWAIVASSPGPSGVASTGGSGWRRQLRSVVIVWGLGPSRLVAESLPSWTATCSRGRSAAATCS